MRAVAEVDGLVESRIGSGLIVYVGLRRGENVAKVEKLAKTIAKLHLFPELSDPDKAFSSSVIDNGFEILVAAQPSLCVGFDKQTPKAATAIDSADAKTAFNAFVRALQAEYQEEMVVAAPLSPLLQVESSGDGPGMYMFDTDAPVVSGDAAASRAIGMSVKQEGSALEPNIASVTEALRRVPMFKGSKATLESCRIFRVFSMKKFRASLADAGQMESDEFAEALDTAGPFFSRTQQTQITEWTGLAITASPEEPAAAVAAEEGDDDFEADEADAEAADGLAQSLAELRGEVSGKRFAANSDKAARRPDWRGRAAPNTPAGAHASAWGNSRFGQNAPWQAKGNGKGHRPAGRAIGGIVSLDEANRLHGNDGSAYEYGQLMRVSDRQVHVAKKELDDDEVGAGAKRRAPASSGNGFKRPKGTPTIAPMCPSAANPLDEL